jgi:hypothetical protein
MQEKKCFLTAFLIGVGILLTSFGPVAGPKLVFSPTMIPDGLYGSAYQKQNLKVTGGKAPYSFSVSWGDLPQGMSISNDGVFSGTPTAAGTFSFTVTALDNSMGHSRLSGSQNYTLVVDQAPLIITANDATMTYGGAAPALTASCSGFVNGDDISGLTTWPTLTTTAGSSSPAGAYPINASGAADPNYTFTYRPGTFHINPAALLVTAKAQTKECGAQDPALTYNFTGLVNGDNTGIFTGSLSRTPGENAGTYPITKGSLSAGNNYTIGYTGNNLTINLASQHITWTQSLLVGCNNTTQMPLTATASSGLPVSYSVADPTVATVSGNVLTLLRPGGTIVTATQAGDANHAAAPPVADTVSYQAASLITQHWNDAIFFDNSDGDYVQWQWYKDGNAVPGATTPYYTETPSLNGQYYVIATNKDSQRVQSCILTITAGAAIPGGIKVFPNPATSGARVTIISNYSTPALQGAVLQITDLNGRVRKQVTTVQPSMEVTMPSETGTYIVSLLLASGQKATVNVLVVQ